MKYLCDICNYETNRKSNFETHLKGVKHPKINNKISGLLTIEEKEENKKFMCKICNSKFTFITGLYRHKKTCTPIKTNVDVNILINKIVELEKEKAENEIARLTEKIELLEKIEATQNEEIKTLKMNIIKI